MKLHSDSGQIKVMVADWDYEKLGTVVYHYCIQSAFDYLDEYGDTPLSKLQEYSSSDIAMLCDDHNAEYRFGEVDLDNIKFIVEELYQDSLEGWNKKIRKAQ